MKKLVIAIAIITTAVTATVGYSEYKEWHEEMLMKDVYNIQLRYATSESEKVNAERYVAYYDVQMNNGIWKSIFNKFK